MVQLNLDPITQRVMIDDRSPTISALWDQAVQEAVVNTSAGPTIGSRAYAMVHTGIYNAWAAYDPIALSTQLPRELQRPPAEQTKANQQEAMSFAAYRILTDLFPSEVALFDNLMAELGFDPDNRTTNLSTPAGVGNVSAQALLEFRRQDGSNQLGTDPNGEIALPYSDTSNYQPVNSPDETRIIDQWTPERVPIDAEPGTEDRIQEFLTPHWQSVEPFAIASDGELRPEAPEPFLLTEAEVNLEQGTITLSDGSVLAITPALVGTVINPAFIEQAETIVEVSANLTDEQKIIAEFWEDGGGTSYPPGTWLTFGQFVSARDNHSLAEDAQLFFALGNAVFDAGIATWEAKRFYDYVRPVRAIRDLGQLGLLGEFDADLGGFAIEAWQPDQGTERILATDFLTYQTPGSDPSPPFAEYTSGHSGFSAAAATVLELFTGSETFDASVTFKAGSSRFEPEITPESPVTLSWETFREAADEAGISRIYGGIHFDDGDLNGRTLGTEVGEAVWEESSFFVGGGSTSVFGSLEADIIDSETSSDFDGQRDLIFSGTGDDVVDTSQAVFGKNRVYGGSSDDELFAGENDRLFGGTGNDTLEASESRGGNRLYGGAGDDIFFNGSSDRAFGGVGNDTFFMGEASGNNMITGGSDADIFAIANAGFPESPNTITDFTSGVDLLQIGGIGELNEFADLSLTESEVGTTVSFGAIAFAILQGVTASSLDSNDFSLF
ncbi:Hemolysin-type calcium-binding region [Halothece sp. PCC 7418]|uniref:DUF6851 domain-containing protein n=1 Tax=Halothece sp. (strain PCC 7418) TaxID=65093 RepID=UPI0002A074CD|nr:hemolysin-type calcium-binding protein [Halothece sp. PCC 7418]AFZ42799.1 Hemolysin-type calcium-binding region [Halothece sp. PCC 7418]